MRAILWLALILPLVSCLPEGKSPYSKKSGSVQAQAEVEKQAAELLSSSTAIQNAIVSSAAWQSGTFTAGLINAAALGVNVGTGVQAAYCPDAAGNPMVLVWIDPGHQGAFGMKGIGFNAGSKIVRSLSNVAGSAGVYDAQSNSMQLTSPLQSGANVGLTQLTLPSSCANLAIPSGAPVVVMESMSQPLTTGQAGLNSYEFKTDPCPNNQVGTITSRRSVTFDPVTLKKTASSNWQTFQTSCANSVTGFNVTVNSAQTSAINYAAQTGSNGISDVLSNLTNIQCREAVGQGTTSQNQTPGTFTDTGRPITNIGPNNPTTAGGGQNNSGTGNINATSCANQGVNLSDVINPFGTSITVTPNVDSQDNLTFPCSTGDLNPISGSFNGFPGLINVGIGWTGSIVFTRYYLDTQSNNGQAQANNVTQREVWEGLSLACARDETMTVSCDAVYPQYSVAPYSVVNAGGFNFARTNRIDGWADPVNLTPNPPFTNDANWTPTGASCSWNETLTFDNCAAGLTPLIPNGGMYQRLITANDTSGNITNGTWTSLTPSVCGRVDVVDSACPANFTGYIRTTTTLTSSANFPWDTPVSSSSTSVQNNCTCNPSIETRGPLACPAGQTGNLYEERQVQCPSGTWGGWTTAASSTCATTTTPFCPAGQFAVACSGSNMSGGGCAGCSLGRPGVDWACNVIFSDYDTSCVTSGPASCGPTVNTCINSNLGLSGYDVPGNVDWWHCYDSNNVRIDCSAPSTRIVNGACGTTANTCSTGAFIDVLDTATNTLWICAGSGGGTPASCSEPITTPPMNCGCGMSEGFASGPTGFCVAWQGPDATIPNPASFEGNNGLSGCSSGNYGNGDGYITCSCNVAPLTCNITRIWSPLACSGVRTDCGITYFDYTLSDGTSGTCQRGLNCPAACRPGGVTRVDGACGTSNNTCTLGSVQDVADTATNYLWNCGGSGGGTTENCSAPITVGGSTWSAEGCITQEIVIQDCTNTRTNMNSHPACASGVTPGAPCNSVGRQCGTTITGAGPCQLNGLTCGGPAPSCTGPVGDPCAGACGTTPNTCQPGWINAFNVAPPNWGCQDTNFNVCFCTGTAPSCAGYRGNDGVDYAATSCFSDSQCGGGGTCDTGQGCCLAPNSPPPPPADVWVNLGCTAGSACAFCMAPTSPICSVIGASAGSACSPAGSVCLTGPANCPNGVMVCGTGAATGSYNGQCGTANGGTFATAPTTGLCATGNATTVVDQGSTFAWTCNPTGSAPSSQNCSATKQVVGGVCGSANGVPTVNPPASNLCSSGTASSIRYTTGGFGTAQGVYRWTCGTTACSAPESFTAQPSGCSVVNPVTGSNMTIGYGNYQLWGGFNCTQINCNCDGSVQYITPSPCPNVGEVGTFDSCSALPCLPGDVSCSQPPNAN